MPVWVAPVVRDRDDGPGVEAGRQGRSRDGTGCGARSAIGGRRAILGTIRSVLDAQCCVPSTQQSAPLSQRSLCSRQSGTLNCSAFMDSRT